MTKGKEAGRIQVYVRVRPFTEKEKEKKEPNAIALHHDHSLIRVLDPRRETNYFFDGVFGPEASNYELYLKVGRPLVYAALNGYKGTLLTYGQTGTGKTYTLLSVDGVTTNVVGHCFERIQDDEIHSYKVTCSFLQVYQEKVYDLLNPRFTVELPVREHPKKGVYVANLTQNEVKSASDVLALLEYGKRQLVMAETKMVRHSSRSHSIMQLIIERRLKAHIAMEQASSEDLGPKSPETVHDSIMAVDETINNLLRELKQERKSHHRRERECLKELMEKELDDSHSFKGDVIVKGKINLCDLAGSERLTKTKAEGVRLTEAKYLNTSLLELGNVIHALARGKQRHVPYRNSTLTRLLQDCLGDNGKTNFIVCIAPSLSEVNETKCSLNFGLRAMRIINVARLNVELGFLCSSRLNISHNPWLNFLKILKAEGGFEIFQVDYKVLAERLAKKLEDQDHRHKLEKLEYLREIQRLNTAVTSYEESEHVVNSDTDTLVSVIQNLSKSVQREKEAKHSLQSELTCLKRKVSNSPTATVPEIEALFLAELMSMQLLTHVYQSEAVFNAVSQSDLPSKVREYMTSTYSQENMLLNTGYMLELLDSCLGFGEQEDNDSKTELEDHRPRVTKAEQSTNQLPSNDKKQSSYVQNMTGGLKRMFGLLVGNKDGGKPDVCSTKSQHSGESTPEHKPRRSSPANARFLVDPNQTMTKLVHTKEKVEKHVANLLLTAFGEQLICSQGNSPQWGVLGRKLSELIMFKRNNIIGIKDTEMWSNYENVANILQSCFKYVLIDKALIASMIVIEHMDGRGSVHKHVTRLPSAGRAMQSKKIQEDTGTIQKSVPEELSSHVANENISEKFQGSYNDQGAKENLGKSFNETASVSPSKQKTGVKGSRTTIEQEINEVFDDTSRLESELFATMEEKARLEDELIIMKDYVNKLKSDMFHLKIERANLESDFKKTAKSIVSLSESAATTVPQKEFINNVRIVTEDYRGLRVGELSDVTEASHESTSGGESENGSHFSEGHEQGSQVLKNCLASMAQMYSLMPNPDDDTLTEGDDSDGKGNGSLSEDDIGESEEENIIITKIAREMQDYHSPSVSSDKVKKAVDIHENQSKEQVNLESTKGIKLKENPLKDALEVQRSNKTLKNLQIAYEDLEDELYHVRGQLSKAQQIILNLESQLNEEKANWEQIRKLYLEYKDKNDVLEGKVAILREELEKSLRENTFLKDYHKVEVVEEGQNKGHSSSTKSPLKSPSRRKVFDLRSIPSIQNSNREMQIIKLLEENTELRTKNEKLSEEKMLAEYHSKENETKAKEMEETVRYTEEQKRALKEKIEALQRRKVKRGNDLLEKREESLVSSTELDLYRKESTRLEKELSTERNMAAKLRNDNNQLSKNIERLQSELDKRKRKHIDNAMANECRDNPIKKEERKSTEGLQMVFIDDSCSEEEVNRELKKTDSLTDHEDGKTVVNLQKEIRSMAEYHEALEKEYAESRKEVEKLTCDCQAKEEHIHSLENEIGNLRKQMNIAKATTGEPAKTIFSRLYMKTTPSKTKSSNEEFDVRERNEGRNQEPDFKNTDVEVNTVKKENSQLRQKIWNSEQKLAIYEADLEKAMLKIKQLQEYRVNQCIGETDSFEKYIDPSLELKDSDLEKVSVGIGNNHSNVTEMKLEKANKEIERLREQLFDKEAEKSLLYDELHLIRLRKDELDKALDEAREAKTELQEKMDEMAKCTHFEDTVKELTEKNQQLDMKLQQKEESALTATKKYEKQNEAFRKLEEELVCASGEKLKSELEFRNAVIEMEKVRNDLQQSKQDLKMLKIELNEKMERSANLEIQLLELKCSNDCMKSEIDQLKEKKRQESHQSQEENICKETMEKRLQEAFLANNQLQSELHNILEENKELNEKLCKALECKDEAEEEVSQLQKQILHLQVELSQTTSEKKLLEGKVKKHEETKRRIEDELKQLKENTNLLHSDLAKIERQQEETNKKCANLEKEIKRKTKELEGKQRDNRRLKKELSTIKEEKKLARESTVNFARNSDEVQKLKAKTEFLEKENEELHNKQMSRESANNTRDGNNKRDGYNQQGNNQHDGSKISNIKKSVTFSPKDKYDVLNTAVCNEIGWDFENDTMVKEIHPDEESNVTVKANKEQHIEIEPQIKRDLSDEVGWDLNYIIVTADDDYCSQDNQGTTLDSFKVETSESATSTQFPKAVSNGEISNPHNQQQQSYEEIRSISVQASLTQISKEKLLLESETARLLESQTSHLTKTQMSLEQSLSKALGENERLLEKLNDSRIILERIKSRVSKLEENVSVSRIEAETQTTHIAEFLPKATHICEELMRSENEVVTPTMEEKENEDAISPTTCELSASSSKAILYLTREKKQVSKELEAIKQSHEDLKKELTAKDKASLQLKQELNKLKFSREEEKKSLSEDLEIMTANYHAVKRKLKEQEHHNTSCKELNEKQIQAERLIVELEKDLMRQTEEKSSLKRKLNEYQNKLNELETTKKELQSLRNENKQMSDVLEAMGKHIASYKKENQELSERLERRKKSWNTISSRKNVVGKKKGISVTIEKKKRSKGAATRVKERRKCYENTNTQNDKKYDPSFESVNSEDTDSSDNENLNDEINVMKECKSDKTNDKQNESIESTSLEKQASTVYLIQNETFDRIGENFLSIFSESLGDNDKIGIRLTKELNVEEKENQQTELQDIKSYGQLEDLVDKELITSDPIVSTNEYQIPLNDDNKCTVGEDINIGDETDEEACIELKLSRILKERQTMEQEMQSMIQQMNDLKAKFAQRQSEENSNEQEDCLLRMQLEKLLHEKTEIEKTVETLKTTNTKLEIELSDATDIKNAMETEIMRIRTGSQEQQKKIEKMNENNTKLESALAILSEENSNLYQDLSTLREENRILKSYKIREIVDGSTQVSSTNNCSTITTKISMKSNDDTFVTKTSSPGLQNPPRSPNHEEKTKELSLSKALLELPINSGGYLVKYPYHTTTDVVVKPLSASSPDTSEKEERGNLNKTGSSIDANNSLAEKVKSQSQEKSNLKGLHNYLTTTPEEESESGYADSKCGNLICSQCRKGNCQCRSSAKGGSSSSNINQNLQNNAVENFTFDTLSNDLEPTGGEACTDSSFASVTDFEDMSFSSDWVSTEDLRSGRVTSRGNRGLSKMHREIAEIKCTNTILENELTIMKNRNSDFQAQLQKLAGKNNLLKQKICDRTLVIKKAEREMAILTEEKMRLEVQVSASKEEISRLELERAKLERSHSNSKSENKRLKNDLAIARADNYKTMKTLVKLEAENKNLQLEVEQTKEQLERQTSANMNTYLILDSSKQNPEEALVSSKYSSAGMEGFSQDRTGLSLLLTDSKIGGVRRASSDQSFPKQNKGGDFILSSESDILSSPEDYPTQRRGPRHPCRSQPLPSATKGAKTYTDTSALTQSEDPRNARTESQMSYSSDLGFPGDWDHESSQSDGGTGASCDVDDKKEPHGGIKKMFKKFTKPKKNTKSSSS